MINNIKSASCKIGTGSPKELCWVPSFLVCISTTFQKHAPGIGLQIYVCDAVVHVSGKTCDAFADKLTKKFEKVSALPNASCLTLNTKKTKSICFSIKKQPATDSFNVVIKDELIKQVTEVKYLWMIWDSQLNFNSNEKICKKFKANLRCFKMIKNCLLFEMCLAVLKLKLDTFTSVIWFNNLVPGQEESLYNHCHILSKYDIWVL